MATVNHRAFLPQATVINGVSVGGTVSVALEAGFESLHTSTPDGLVLAVQDRETQYVRGVCVVEDWPAAINLLLGAVGSLVYYERKSGVAAATGYLKHTLLNPKIHNVRLSINKGGWATVSFGFECQFASEVATINDVWAITDTQAAPTYLPTARGGWRISDAKHGQTDIFHLMSLSLDITRPMLKACNDADVGYTAVDLAESGMTVGGSIGFQDASVDSSILQCNKLLVASLATLTATIVQSGSAAAKVITIARCQFTGGGANGGGNTYSQFDLRFGVTNDPAAPLTLDGDNKIITIADAT